MKKTIFFLVFETTFVAASLLSGCEPSTQKTEDSSNLMSFMTMASTNKWNTFKLESEEQINAYDLRITELRANMKTSGNAMDAIYAKRIDKLEQKNRNLQEKINAYEKHNSDWEVFEREYKQETDQLEQAFKDIKVKKTDWAKK